MKRILAVVIAAVMLTVMLAGCGSESNNDQNGFNVNVYVKDESGKPVSGVKVQACDDTLCMVADTDAEGYAGFSTSNNVVDVHILKAPEGFAFDSEATFKTDDSGSVTVTLKAS